MPVARKVEPAGSDLPGRDSGRLVDRVTQDLRRLILDHEIAPGTVLIQTDWARKLQVSRTPLREAFRILEQDGLVRASNGNRTVEVVRFTDRDLRDLYEVRKVVDGLAARLLTEAGISPALDAELSGLLDAMDSSRTAFSASAWFTAHSAFHLRIVQSCGNPRVSNEESLVRLTSYSLHAYLADLPTSGDELQQILELANRQHRSIYAALNSGSGDLAEMAACRHIQTTLTSNLIKNATEPLVGSAD